MFTDYILIFIDYLLIPFISLGIDMRRAGKETVMTLRAFIQYVSYTLAIVIISYVVRVVMSRLGIGVNTDAGTGVYTVLATVIALVLPYLKEIILTYVNIRCEIKGKKDASPVEK